MTKRETWEAIKKVDPETAQFILDVKEIFGQLLNVEIFSVSRETKDEK